MRHTSWDIEAQSDASNLATEISDDELEAAAITTAHAVMSFPSAPTVSVVFMCCGNDHPAENVTPKFTPRAPFDVVLESVALPQASAMQGADEP